MKKYSLPLLFIAGFIVLISLKYILPLEVKNEQSLINRYEGYTSLIKKGDYEEAYTYIDPSLKQRISKEDFVKSFRDSNENFPEIKINSVVIRGDFGFIDRTRSNDGITTRRYQKWIWNKNNWYATSESPLCIRDQAYDKPAEFDRAISLINQRLQLDKNLKDDNRFFNCLDIQYANLDDLGAEGVFYFDPSVSSLERLIIKVDDSYVYSDDLLTASLIAHEMVHAEQFISEIALGSVGQSCVNKEVEAYGRQIDFLLNLNQEEKNSISSRVNFGGTNQQLFSIKQLNNEVLGIAMSICNVPNNSVLSQSDTDCLSRNIANILASIISNNPYYKQQCSL